MLHFFSIIIVISFLVQCDNVFAFLNLRFFWIEHEKFFVSSKPFLKYSHIFQCSYRFSSPLSFYLTPSSFFCRLTSDLRPRLLFCHALMVSVTSPNFSFSSLLPFFSFSKLRLCNVCFLRPPLLLISPSSLFLYKNFFPRFSSPFSPV